ncbi:DUF6090 family protein [Algoriphagus marinus]|uniref:DUF6090 family protein n=1 Tax=Algoriphagus marinus TaxID=1925762 RepID=UPI00094B8C4E|nr:DUF6090 family protein [Algoriphagus marinus]
MISFFRKIRQKLMQQNRVTQYLAYAIGEIFLVTIGILIALQINDWNENRKEKAYLRKVYTQIRQDLQNDTLNLRVSIEDLEAKNARITEIIERTIPVSYYDTLSEANYQDCVKCVSDITNLEPFQYLDKGYQLLKAVNTAQNFEQDSLNNTIIQFYSEYLPVVDESQNLLIDLSKSTLAGYQQYDWFISYADFGRKTYNKEFIQYIFESEKHRRASAHYLIFSKFGLRILREYRDNSIQILQFIDEKLAE